MTKRDILSVALKIIGFNFILYSLIVVMSILQYISLFNNPIAKEYHLVLGLGGNIITFILVLAGAYILLRFSDKIAEKLIPIDKEVHIFVVDNWQKDVFSLALRIIGVVTLVKNIPHLVGEFIESPTYIDIIKNASISQIIYRLLIITIGIYLLLGGKHLVKIIFKEKVIEQTESQKT
jgi:uncharacterized membrane protein YbhN (UPF0104 family)